jgi:hypothetical protein
MRSPTQGILNSPNTLGYWNYFEPRLKARPHSQPQFYFVALNSTFVDEKARFEPTKISEHLRDTYQ